MRPLLPLAPTFALCSATLAWATFAWAADQKRPTDEQRGKELYDRHCAACHGVSAEGHGPATQALVVQVPDLKGKLKVDQATIDLVVMGRGPMPSFEASFDAEDARRVLAYMTKLGTAPPVAPDPPAPAPEPGGEPAEGRGPEDGPEDAQGGAPRGDQGPE